MDFEREDLVISDFLDSLGSWCEEVIIGGGYALIIYRLYVADRKGGSSPVGTRDIDTLISRQPRIVSQKSISRHLCESGYRHQRW